MHRTLKVKEGTHTEGVSEQWVENVRTEEKSSDRRLEKTA
jgi:hypothetical protein